VASLDGRDFREIRLWLRADNVTNIGVRINDSTDQCHQKNGVPLYMLVNLAMGGGWPIGEAVSPSYMYVDYVRAYAKQR